MSRRAVESYVLLWILALVAALLFVCAAFMTGLFLGVVTLVYRAFMASAGG